MPDRTDTIPATQNGMGILSYLNIANCAAARMRRFLGAARAMGDYLLNEALTPNVGTISAFTRSTGRAARFPQPADCGSQADRPYEIEPDKGGIAGYALVQLFKASGAADTSSRRWAMRRTLGANQRQGDACHSPWPFRADYRSGEARGAVSGNMTYILRLYRRADRSRVRRVRGAARVAVALDQAPSDPECGGGWRSVRPIL